MGSRERSGLPLANRPATTAVDINLDALFPKAAGEMAPATTGPTDGYLVLSGWTAGALNRWLRSSTGQWIGVCTILIGRTDGSVYKAVEQLVPAEALRSRRT